MIAELLHIIRCPKTLSPLELMDAAELAQWNARIAAGDVDSLAGITVRLPLDAALINSDHSLIIPVRRGVTLMIDSELIATVQPHVSGTPNTVPEEPNR